MSESNNIYWREVQTLRKIKGAEKVVDHGTHYSFNGKTIFWHGDNDTVEALRFLRNDKDLEFKID